jgi:tripartite-type tricarboxylate transporter receptor subunit TctC
MPSDTPVRLLALACAFAASFPAGAAAPDGAYPSRPLRFVVPFPPGGGNDILARTIGNRLTEVWGQQVVIDNRAGAGGVIGAEIAARAAPDGYTMFLGGVASLAINPNLHRRLSYDPVKDFAPASLAASAPLVLVVHPSLPVKTVKDLVAAARAKPGQINFASNGLGGSSHLAAELFRMMAGADITHVPYKGFSPALTDLLSGQVQLMFSSVVPMLPQVKAGRLRAVAMTGAKRSAALPEVATVAESGVPGYETASWYGVLFPRGTPAPVIASMHAQVARIVALPDVRERLAADGAEPVGSTPEAFAQHIRVELARWRKVIEAAKLKTES